MTIPTAAPSPQQAVADSVLDELARQWANGAPIVLCYDGEGRPIDGWEFSMPRFRSAVRSALATLAPQAVSEPPAGVAVAWQYLSDHEGWKFVSDEQRDRLKRAGYQIRALGVLATPTHQAAEAVIPAKVRHAIQAAIWTADYHEHEVPQADRELAQAWLDGLEVNQLQSEASERIRALEDALRACEDEKLTDPQDNTDDAYNQAVRDCANAIRAIITNDREAAHGIAAAPSAAHEVKK